MDQFWWQPDVEEERRHELVMRYVSAVEDAQRTTYERMLQYARLYDESDLMGADGSITTGGDSGPVTENVIESVIDTAMALIAKQRSKATFVTDGADWQTWRRAHQLERFIEAEFHRTEIYDESVRVFRDSCVFGLGVLKIFEEDGQIAVERVIPDEIIVDKEECRLARPQQIHQRRIMDRGILAVLYPEHAEAIDNANRGSEAWWTSFRHIKPKQIVVVESWRRPSKRGAGDGRHTICIQGATLLDEEWTKDNFPLIFIRWAEKVTGFYGRGLCEQLAGAQNRINKHNWTISKSQDLFAMPRVFVQMVDAQLKIRILPRIGQIIPHKGTKPVIEAPPILQPEYYQSKENLKAWAYQSSGVSESAARSAKQPDLESAPALREQNDIESQRFSLQFQRLEQFYLDAARLFVVLAKEIYGRTRKLRTSWTSRNLRKTIDWGKVDLAEDLYTMGIEASSLLSRTPAGRLQQAMELIQSGFMEAGEARRQLGHPDIDRDTDLETAAIEDIEATIEDMLDGGDYTPPEAFQDLKEGIARTRKVLLKIRHVGAPEAIMQNLRDWIEDADQMLKDAAASAQQPDPSQMGAGPYQPNVAAPTPGAPPMPGAAPAPPMAAA